MFVQNATKMILVTSLKNISGERVTHWQFALWKSVYLSLISSSFFLSNFLFLSLGLNIILHYSYFTAKQIVLFFSAEYPISLQNKFLNCTQTLKYILCAQWFNWMFMRHYGHLQLFFVCFTNILLWTGIALFLKADITFSSKSYVAI